MTFIWDEELRNYDFGPGHPLSPIRSVLAYKLIQSLGILDQANVTTVESVDLAPDEQICGFTSRATWSR